MTTLARRGRPTNSEVSVREYRKQEKYLREQVSSALPVLGASYADLMERAVHIALHDETGEGMRMLRFLVELPFRFVPTDEEVVTVAGQLREKWTYERMKPARKETVGQPEETGDTGLVEDAEYRVVEPAS